MTIGKNPRQYMGVEAKNPPNVWKADRAPTAADDGQQYRVGDLWIDETAGDAYEYVSAASWAVLGGSTSAVSTIGGDSGSAVPASGNVDVVGSNGLVTSATGDTVTVAPDSSSIMLQYADVTITAAEIKAIETTPIELVAAPAAGSAHLFMGAVLKLDYGSEVFAETDDNLVIKYTNGSGVSVSDAIEMTGFIDQSADTQTNAVPIKDAIVASAAAEAQALVLFNPDDAITGNASNDSTVTVRTYYVTQAL